MSEELNLFHNFLCSDEKTKDLHLDFQFYTYLCAPI